MTTPPRQRYPEKGLQLAAMAWLKEHWGYRELFCDVEATGARMDSAGQIGDQVYVVEVKLDVGANVVEHADDRPNNLESKIAGTLRPIYARAPGGISERVNAQWDRRRPLIVAILARSITPNAREALAKIVSERSEIWKFDFRLWIWNGAEVVETTRVDLAVHPDPSFYEGIEIPRLIGRTSRAPSRSLEEFRALAVASKIEHLFEAMIEEASRGGFRIQLRRGTIGLLRSRPGRTSPETMIALYLDTNDTEGRLWVGCWAEAIGVDPSRLPGVPAPTNGFQNTNLYLASSEEVRELVRLFSFNSNVSDVRPSP